MKKAMLAICEIEQSVSLVQFDPAELTGGDIEV